jgi:hypothetical protein
VAFAALDHRREEGAGEQHRRLEVDPHRPLHVLLAEVGEPAGPGKAGIGDEHIDPAGVGGELLGRARLGQVRRHDAVIAVGELRRQRLECLRLASAQQQRCPALGQSRRDRPAEAAGGAGEECCAAGKFHPKAQASSRAADRILG